MIKNLHHIMPSPFEKLRIFREGGPRQRWMRCWNLTGGKNKQYRRAGACSCRLVRNLINGKNKQYRRAGACSCRSVWNYINCKNDNIVGQGIAPAVWCGILPMAERANTVRPYGWKFYQCFKIRTPTMPSPTRRRGTAPAVDEVLEFNRW